MSAHSPGPWRWEDWPENRTVRLRGNNGDSILRIHDDEHARHPSAADARLIAAAPELLRRLKRSIREGHVYRPDCTWDDGKPCYACDDTEFLRALVEEGGK